MRIRISHSTRYEYEREVRSILQVLRVTPRPHEGQQVIDWRLDADADVRLRWTEDAFGNIAHSLSIERPVSALTVTVTGEVVTTDTAGVVRGAVERLPEQVYLRTTPRTKASPEIVAFARDSDPGADAGELARLHALLTAVKGAVAFDVNATDADTSAADAFTLGRGVCQDLAHVFISAARTLGIPARYVSGHLLRGQGQELQEASHAWAEALVPGLGWVGFDPTNGICPTDDHVRVAIGLDYLDASPVRGARSGGGMETMTVRLKVAPSDMFQTQSQSQTLQSKSLSQSQSQSQSQS
jgi:transglutaminase-like putative cysteine protease